MNWSRRHFPSFAEEVRFYRERRDRAFARIEDDFEQMGYCRYPARFPGFVSLHRSTRGNVPYQVTFWSDEMEPTGHIDAMTWESALDETYKAMDLKTV